MSELFPGKPGAAVRIRMADGYGNPISVRCRAEDLIRIGDEFVLRVERLPDGVIWVEQDLSDSEVQDIRERWLTEHGSRRVEIKRMDKS